MSGGALVLHYLPEFGMRTGEILGTEALVRWQHPTRGLLMPESFIGVAESIDLAGKLGRLVMRSALRAIRTLALARCRAGRGATRQRIAYSTGCGRNCRRRSRPPSTRSVWMRARYVLRLPKVSWFKISMRRAKRSPD